MAELLLGKGYTVHGIKRRSSLFNTERVRGVPGPTMNPHHAIDT